MKKLLILNDVVYASKIGSGVITSAYATGASANDLAASAFAAFTEDGRLLTAANANTVLNAQPDSRKIYFAVGSGDTTKGARISAMIDRATAVVNVKAYVAPVKKVIVVGANSASTAGLSLNLPATLTVGDLLSMVVTHNQKGTVPPTYFKRYSYDVQVGDTATTIITNFIAKVNADAARVVQLTVVGSQVGFTVASLLNDTNINIALDGVLSNATQYGDGTVTDSVALVYSRGSGDVVAAMELESDAESGDDFRLVASPYYYSRTRMADTAKKYTIINIQWLANREGTTISSAWREQQVDLAIDITAAGATIPLTTVMTILAEAFGVNRINVETGS